MATPIFPLVDRILEGRLAETLRVYRAEGLSYEQISRRLADEHQIEIVTETVRKWCIEVAADEPTQAVS